MDLIHKGLKAIDHNRGVVLGIMAGIVAAAVTFGCQPKTYSLFEPGMKVDAAAFEREAITKANDLEITRIKILAAMDAYNADAESVNEEIEVGRADIQQQVERTAAVLEVLGGLAQSGVSGEITPAGAVGSVISMIMLGGLGLAGWDAVRRGRVIKNLKAKNGNGAPAPATEATT